MAPFEGKLEIAEHAAEHTVIRMAALFLEYDDPQRAIPTEETFGEAKRANHSREG